MGCWNGTCGLTHLPIIAGEPIRAVLIAGIPYRHDGTSEEQWGSGFCYNTDIWHPRTIAIKGVYNDYGGVEDLELSEVHRKIIYAGFEKDLVEHTPEEDTYYDRVTVEALKTLDPLELFNGWIERDRIEVYDLDRKDMTGEYKDWPAKELKDIRRQPVGLWMCHEWAFQAAIHAAKSWRGDTLATLQRSVSSHLRRLETAAGITRMLEFCDDLTLLGPKEDGSVNLAEWFKDPPFCRGLEFYQNQMSVQLNSGEPESEINVSNLLWDCTEFFALQLAMMQARIAWMPQSGKGSQDDSIHVHDALAKAVRAYARKHKRSSYGDA